MKALHDIKLMIAECQERGEDLKRLLYSDKDREKRRERDIKALQKKAAELKTVVLYLETNPQSEFIHKEVTRLTGRKNAIMQFRPKPDNGEEKNPEFTKIIKAWEKEQGIEKINKQLKALKFIMS